MPGIFSYYGQIETSTQSPSRALRVENSPKEGLFSRIGKAMTAPFYAVQESAQNTLDPRISSKRQEILAHNRTVVSPYNDAIKTLITENSSSADIDRALGIAKRTLALTTRKEPIDLAKLEKLEKLTAGLEAQAELTRELEAMRAGNYISAGAAHLALNATAGAYALATAHSQADRALTAFSQNFSLDTLLSDDPSGKSSHENLYMFLVGDNGALIKTIAAPILKEIQTEVSWLTDEKAFEVILHSIFSTIQSYTDTQATDVEVSQAYAHLQIASKPLALLKKKKALLREHKLLTTHYRQTREVSKRAAYAKKELEALDNQIKDELPHYAELKLEDALASSKSAFEIAKTQYLTALTKEEDYKQHLDSAKAGALESTTKLLLKETSKTDPQVIRQIKALIKHIVFLIVRFVVRDLLNGNIDAGIVEGIASSAEKYVHDQLQDHTFGALVKSEHRELMPAIVGAHIKALIPRILKEVPEAIEQFKKKARDLSEEELNTYIESNFRLESIEGRIKNLSEKLVDELVQEDRLGLNITGARAAAAIARPLIRSKLPSGPSAAALGAVGAEVHRWVGTAPSSNSLKAYIATDEGYETSIEDSWTEL
jgi:hypothetical protein